jgi:hypothetical protein
LPQPTTRYDDPNFITADYSVVMDGVNATFIGPDGGNVASFIVPFVGYEFRGTYFVSEKLQRGYILFEEDTCSDEKTVGVAIILLSTGEVSFSTTKVFEKLLPIGFDCDVTGGDVEVMYEDIQVVALPGYGGICLEHTYVFFNETNVHYTSQKSSIQSWDMIDAIVYGDTANENRAFLVIHEYWEDDSCPEAVYSQDYSVCPEKYFIQEIVISTAEILRTVELDRQDIASIISGNYTPGDVSQPPEQTPETTTYPPTPEPGTPEPTPSGTSIDVPTRASCFLIPLCLLTIFV